MGGSGAGSPTSPTTTTTPPALKSITIGKGTNDYANSILNDPAFGILKNTLSAQGISDAAHLRGAIQQALIQFGAVPNLPTDVLSSTGLDTAGTQSLADANPFSTLKRLAQSYQDQQDAAKNQLAARGILSSGETGYQLGRLGQQQAGAQYDATNSLLGSIGTLNDQYLAGQKDAASKLASGALTAEGYAAGFDKNGAYSGSSGTPGVTATWDPSTGLYKDPTGNYYDQNGNPVAFNAPTGGLQAQVAAPAPSNPLPPTATPDVGYQQSPRLTGTYSGI